MKHHLTRTAALIALLVGILLIASLSLAQDATPEATAESTAEATEVPTDAPAAGDQQAAADTGLSAAVRQLHSFVRWLVLLAAVAALVKLGLGLLQNAEYDPLTQRLMVAFAMLLSVQWLVGLVFLLAYGGIVGFGTRHFWEHAIVMTIATGLAHSHRRWKNADSRSRYRSSLLIVIVALVLVVIGVSLLPFNAWHLAPGL